MDTWRYVDHHRTWQYMYKMGASIVENRLDRGPLHHLDTDALGPNLVSRFIGRHVEIHPRECALIWSLAQCMPQLPHVGLQTPGL